MTHEQSTNQIDDGITLPRSGVPHVSEFIPLIIPILKKHYVIKAYVVGSFARDKQTTESDIDILCTFDESKGIHIMKIVQLALELEEKLNRTVDIVDDYSLTNSIIRQSMMKDAIPLKLSDSE